MTRRRRPRTSEERVIAAIGSVARGVAGGRVRNVRQAPPLQRNTGMSPSGADAALPCTQQSTNYTLTLSDLYTCIEFTSSSGRTCTVPPSSSIASPVGAWVQVRQFGAGQVTFVAGSGVTLRSPNGALRTCTQYATIVLHQRAVDDWVVIGDLV